MAVDRDIIVNDILNNGLTLLYGTVPQGHRKTRKQEWTSEKKMVIWKRGLQELDKDELEFALTISDSESSKKIAENLKYQWESALPGLTISTKQVPPKQSVATK